jgi:cytochrome c oxidase subunit 2
MKFTYITSLIVLLECFAVNLFKSPFSYLDSPEDWQIGFQDPASPIMQGIIELHHDLFFFLIIVLSFVFWLLFKILFTFNSVSNKIITKTINYGTILEIVWTIVPALVLLLVAIPSFTLLYSMDEVLDPMLTLKVIGHQ